MTDQIDTLSIIHRVFIFSRKSKIDLPDLKSKELIVDNAEIFLATAIAKI